MHTGVTHEYGTLAAIVYEYYCDGFYLSRMEVYEEVKPHLPRYAQVQSVRK